MRRTNTCGELRSSDLGKKVCLQGWVRFSRDHGGVAFIDLADRYRLPVLPNTLSVLADSVKTMLPGDQCVPILRKLYELPIKVDFNCSTRRKASINKEAWLNWKTDWANNNEELILALIK